MKHWPFKIVGRGDKPVIQVKYRGETREFVSPSVLLKLGACPERALQTPEEISAMVLGKMKETAESYLGETVTHAVVTVPACKSPSI